jgi:uncharacterized membrane protein
MVFFSAEMVSGGFLIFFGGLLKLFPPKTRNLYGYRTSLSLKNDQNWEAGNKTSADLLILGGCLNILTDFVLLFIIPSKRGIRVLICIFLMIMASILTIVITETKLKKIDRKNN